MANTIFKDAQLELPIDTADRLEERIKERERKKKKYPEPPKGSILIFRPYRKTKGGKLLWAKNYGFKAWPMYVDAKTKEPLSEERQPIIIKPKPKKKAVVLKKVSN